jgi:hypothetical protein
MRDQLAPSGAFWRPKVTFYSDRNYASIAEVNQMGEYE